MKNSLMIIKILSMIVCLIAMIVASNDKYSTSAALWCVGLCFLVLAITLIYDLITGDKPLIFLYIVWGINLLMWVGIYQNRYEAEKRLKEKNDIEQLKRRQEQIDQFYRKNNSNENKPKTYKL